MQAYVCGFRFSKDRSWVVLIEKNRPAIQVGKLNGIGGKIKPGEKPRDAMAREFLEEAGIVTSPDDWQHTVTLSGKDGTWRVFFFRSFTDEDGEPLCSSRTDEKVAAYVVDRLFGEDDDYHKPLMSNLRWLIPMNRAVDLVYPIGVADDWAPARDDIHAVQAPEVAGPWVWSQDEETFGDPDRFVTREEAAAAGLAESGGAAVWTGRAEPYVSPRSRMAEHVLEWEGERAYEHAGEAALDWLEDMRKGEVADLQDRLSQAFVSWLQEYGHVPRFYEVKDIKQHVRV